LGWVRLGSYTVSNVGSNCLSFGFYSFSICRRRMRTSKPIAFTSLTDMYCMVDTKATPVSVQGVGVNCYIDTDFASPQRCEMCTLPPIQWKPGALTLGVKRLGLETDHSPPKCRGQRSRAIPPLSQYAFMGWCSVKSQGQLYLYLTNWKEAVWGPPPVWTRW